MSTYFSERNIKTTQKIKKMQTKLPDCCNDFLLGIENSSSALSRLGYCYDLMTFLTFLSRECPKFYGKETSYRVSGKDDSSRSHSLPDSCYNYQLHGPRTHIFVILFFIK